MISIGRELKIRPAFQLDGGDALPGTGDRPVRAHIPAQISLWVNSGIMRRGVIRKMAKAERLVRPRQEMNVKIFAIQNIPHDMIEFIGVACLVSRAFSGTVLRLCVKCTSFDVSCASMPYLCRGWKCF